MFFILWLITLHIEIIMYKEVKIIFSIVLKTHIAPSPFWRGDKIYKNVGKEGWLIFFEFCGGTQKRAEGYDFFFIFIFSLLAIILTDSFYSLVYDFFFFFFKVVVQDTFKHCSHNTDLLIFFLKFRLSPVGEYLN